MNTDDRLINLEIKFTHQDDLVDQLNKIVTDQQIMIEKMQQDITDLKRLMVSGDVSGNRSLKDDIPPHY